MLRLTIVAAVSGCALYGGTDQPDEPSVVSSAEVFEVPQDIAADVDIVFVIDSSPAMATVRDHVLANVPGIAAAIEQIYGGRFHIGVITSDVADRGALVGGRFLSMAWNPDDSKLRDFDGTLAEALAPMFDVGTQGGIGQPLATLDLALAPTANPGFRRPDAALLVVPITNRDDDSTGAIDDYLATTPKQSVFVSGVYARPAPRLDAFLARFAYQTQFTAITDDDLAPAIGAVQYLYKDLLVLKCFDGALVTPFDCAMSDVVSGVEQQPVRECDPTASNRPCWTIHPDPMSCVTGQKLRLDVRRSVWPARNTELFGQCVTKTLAN